MVFVQAGHRRYESQVGLAYLGVPLSRQVYFGLPDGAVNQRNEFQSLLTETAFDFAPRRIFTLGPEGYDFHADHIASHIAAIGAVSLLRETGHEVDAWSLSRRHEGWLSDGDYWQKIGAIAMHASQAVSPDLNHWGDTDFYTPLIVKGEHYGIL